MEEGRFQRGNIAGCRLFPFLEGIVNKSQKIVNVNTCEKIPFFSQNAHRRMHFPHLGNSPSSPGGIWGVLRSRRASLRAVRQWVG